jgi:putative membrane protein
MKKDLFPKILLIIYIVVFMLLAVNPYDRFDWFAENLPTFVIVLILIFTRKKFQFSNFTYFMMFIGVIWHTIGGYYTYERVPFDLVNNLFGFARNNYDRFGHFIAGFFALPFTEYAHKKGHITSLKTALLYGLFAIGFIAASYEIFETIFAITFGGENAANFLGSQGDIWDAQWDMLMDILGAIFALGIFSFLRFRKRFISNK